MTLNVERLKMLDVHFSTSIEDRLNSVRGLDKEQGKIPDAVVFPRDEDEVLKVVELALEEHIPLVPRGGGVSSAGGIVMKKGGIMVDMRRMKGIQAGKGEVMVEAGSGYLFNARVYPTLWKHATVGGNFCGGSWGIGSMEYGLNWDNVLEVRMVNPRGKMTTLRGGDVKVAAHAEGTTGIVTRLRLMTRESLPIVSKIIMFNGLEEAITFTRKLYEEVPPLYHMVLRSPEIAHLTLGPDKWHLVIAYQKGRDVEIQGEDGKVIWENRDKFFAGAYMENFNYFEYSTYHLPLESFGESLKKASSMGAISEVEFANDFKAHLDFMGTNDIMDKIRTMMGKSSFDVNDVFINSRLSRDHIQKIMWYKRAYDKEDLFNPGKVKF
ncbi:FAD-binding oxidoreductase [Sulfuracidifex metallicus]|uniref:FAD-binding oxidoreductase n=1 Tax=Sulfuracidifex metallicus TaxID=47303 RepID=UPI00227593D2|nr:FAD-binding oxidoreductase [Sulfuracidifex metallicus]MCY0850203.1 FAD-binding oxidoreductase [Sulfuracidifex metallicus]